MRKEIVILIVCAALLSMSCNQSAKKTEYVNSNSEETSTNIPHTNKGYTLMKTYCYACHNPNTVSHDSILAPPFRAVKMRYSRAHNNKKDFVNAIVNWVQNPDENKALMLNAVKRFKIMPKFPLETQDLEAIASYIYENKAEQPEWMEAHMKEMQGQGRGQGMSGKNY